MLTLIYFILILGVIVLVHEFGHFMFSKMFGVYVYEFAIGMGPKIFSWKGKNKETTYSIRAIPIGGFCQLAGEDGDSDDDKKLPDDRKLYTKPVWQRALIMFFGAGNNFILAILVLFIIGILSGAPSLTPKISGVTENYPAAIAGIEKGDIITGINKDKVETLDDAQIYINLADKTKPITIEVKKTNGDIKEYKIKTVEEELDGVKRQVIGINLEAEKRSGFLAVLDYTFGKTKSLFKQMILTLEMLFTGKAGVNDLSGPVGIYNIVDEQKKAGLINLLYLVPLLSINVGFLNLLPFPAFDGGRLLFLLIEKIKGSPVKPEVEGMIHSVGFILLMVLMLYVTFNDILRLF